MIPLDFNYTFVVIIWGAVILDHLGYKICFHSAEVGATIVITLLQQANYCSSF